MGKLLLDIGPLSCHLEQLDTVYSFLISELPFISNKVVNCCYMCCLCGGLDRLSNIKIKSSKGQCSAKGLETRPS